MEPIIFKSIVMYVCYLVGVLVGMAIDRNFPINKRGNNFPIYKRSNHGTNHHCINYKRRLLSCGRSCRLSNRQVLPANRKVEIMQTIMEVSNEIMEDTERRDSEAQRQIIKEARLILKEGIRQS